MLVPDTNRLLGAALSPLLPAVCLPMGYKMGWGLSPWSLAWSQVNEPFSEQSDEQMEEDAQMRKLRLEEGKKLTGLDKASPQLEDRHALSSPRASDSSALFPGAKAELAVKWGEGSWTLVGHGADGQPECAQ